MKSLEHLLDPISDPIYSDRLERLTKAAYKEAIKDVLDDIIESCKEYALLAGYRSSLEAIEDIEEGIKSLL